MTAAAAKLKSRQDLKTRGKTQAAPKGTSPYAFMLDALGA
jgi:hypothetical protein